MVNNNDNEADSRTALWDGFTDTDPEKASKSKENFIQSMLIPQHTFQNTFISFQNESGRFSHKLW